MDDRDFELWESAHILATGANANQLREVLEANRTTFAGMGATYADLCEATERAIQAGGMNWPNEHVAAIVRELKSILEERSRESRKGTYGAGGYAFRHEPGCDCPDCNGGEIKPSYEKRISDRDAKLKELKAYIRKHGGQVAGEGPKAKRKVRR